MAKALLVALLVHALLFPDLAQYQHKGIGFRIALYPLATLVVPLVWLVAGGVGATRTWSTCALCCPS